MRRRTDCPAEYNWPGDGLWKSSSFFPAQRGVSMRKSVRRRPELESLESIALLSGIPTAAHPGVAALVDHLPQARKTIKLSGTVKGTYSASLFGPVKFSAQGTVSPLGSVTATGSLNVLVVHPSGTMTVKTSHGNINVKMSENFLGGPVTVTINGGTSRYLGAHGTGSGSITRTGVTHGTFSLKFTATLVCLHC
jgi:hypothetical protein